MKKSFLLLLTLFVASFAVAQPGGGNGIASFLTTDKPIEARGYDSHVELRWKSVPKAESYDVMMVDADRSILRAQTQNLFYLDFINDVGLNRDFSYKVVAYDGKGKKIAETPVATAAVRNFDDDRLLEMVQEYTFRYFWDFADPISGLAFERSNDSRANCVTTGGAGFGIMAMIAAVENGFVTRRQAVDRLLKIVGSLEKFTRFHGAWAHWYDSSTNKPYSFSVKDNGGDLVETAFLVEGLLAAKGYFDASDKTEKELGQRIEKLWREVEWSHYTQGQPALYWHWSAEYGFEMNHQIKGYDETFITYILAAASPTYPIDKRVYDNCWVNHKDGEFFCQSVFYDTFLPLGKRMQLGGPLFWIHYSYIGLCPKGLRDAYADYWEQNRRYTLVNRAYCIDNPCGWRGYGEGFWGLTACDALPHGYGAHSPGAGADRGTVAPTGALSSMPYTPQESMEVLKNLYRNHGRLAFGPLGFYDAVNFSVSGRNTTYSYLAIDQGPIVTMIQNHRNAAIWRAFMKNGDVLEGLRKLGFTYDKSFIEQ